MFISPVVNTRRSLLGEDNQKTISLLSTKVPLITYSAMSGQKCFDWEVPQEWILKKAVLQDLNGNVLVDADDNILHVVQHSQSCNEIISKDDFANKLHYLEDLPDTIPYRTSYYDREWGICLTYNQYKKLQDDHYRVIIESEFVDSFMTVGELVLPGRSEKEIILSSYFCHPNQINDGLSGVECLLNLYEMMKYRTRHFTYRFIFIPETIGSIFLLSEKIIEPELVEYALVVSCVGVGEKMHFKKTFSEHKINNIIESFDITTYEFQPIGSDERQYSSPKIRIPTGLVMRSPYFEGTPVFKQYHTSDDNFDLIDEKLIEDTSNTLFQILEKYEHEPTYLINHEGGEPFLSKHKLYRKVGTTGHDDWGQARNWVLFLSDGQNTIYDMVKKSKCEIDTIKDVIDTLIKNEIINECRNNSR